MYILWNYGGSWIMGLAKDADPKLKLKAAKMQPAGRLQAHLPPKLSLS